MLASIAPTLHIGSLVDRFFDPASAVWLKHAMSPDPKRPPIALCEPTRCQNTCIPHVTDRDRNARLTTPRRCPAKATCPIFSVSRSRVNLTA